jgi:hypothetical protein
MYSTLVNCFEQIIDSVLTEIMSPNQNPHFIDRLQRSLNSLNIICRHNIILMSSFPSQNLAGHNALIRMMCMVLRLMLPKLQLPQQMQLEPLMLRFATFVME